jgi:hypothetical protein
VARVGHTESVPDSFRVPTDDATITWAVRLVDCTGIALRNRPTTSSFEFLITGPYGTRTSQAVVITGG